MSNGIDVGRFPTLEGVAGFPLRDWSDTDVP